MTEWEDLIVGDRVQVDRAFGDRLRSSRFSRQEWGLIMTAVEFEIEGEGDDARLVADTGRLGAVMPEIGRMRRERPVAGKPAPSGGGLLDSIRSALGLGGGSRVDPEIREEAIQLADEYAAALQEHLVENGKWEQVLDRVQPSPE